MRSEIFKILKGAVLISLFLLCGAVADEAKFKPAPPLNIEEMGIPKINEANRLDDDDAPLDL